MPKKRSAAERFWEKVQKDPDERGAPGCWNWKGSLAGGGYGWFAAVGRPNRKSVQAHRWSYDALVGAIPGGLDLDHLCRNRGCVNPAHLEPVTHRENLLRGNTIPAANARKTHCPYGHPFDGENLYIAPAGRGCRACRKARLRDYYLRNRERLKAKARERYRCKVSERDDMEKEVGF